MDIRRVKVILLGESGVGKTSLLNQFVNSKFYEYSCSTVGIDVMRKNINLKNGDVCVEVWDTAGQERFRTFAISHFRVAERVLLVFDLTDVTSFKQIDRWRNEVFRQTGLGNDRIMLVGNKADIASAFDEAREYAEHHGLVYREISATDYESVEKLFIDLVEMGPISDNETLKIDVNTDNKRKRKCCRL